MASFRSRVHSTPSKHFSKSPSLQNVYTAGMSERQERGVFMNSSLSRTHSTSDLHSYWSSRTRRSLADFNRGHSGRRSTLSVPCSGQLRPDIERLRGNDTTSKQDPSNLCHSLRVEANSSSNLHRQVFQQNSRSLNRPPCLSAPTSPRNSVGSTQSFVHPPHNSAPPSPQGSVIAVHSGTAPNLRPSSEDEVFDEPETDPFHEEYKKRWGNAAIDAAYGIYSSQLISRNDSNNNNTTSAVTNAQKNTPAYGIYSRDHTHARTSGTSDGFVVSSHSSTNSIFSSGLRQNGYNTVPEKDEILINLGQSSTYTAEMSQQGSQVNYYGVDGNSANTGTYNNSRNSPNSMIANQSYCQPDENQNNSVQTQSQQNINPLGIRGQIYVSNSQLPSGNANIMNRLETCNLLQRTHHRQKEIQEHPPQFGRGTFDTNAHVPSVNSIGLQQPTHILSHQNNEQLQNQKGRASLAISDGIYSSFFQTSSNNNNSSPQQSSAKETANVLFQKHFQCRRGSYDSEISPKRSSISRSDENNVTRPSRDKPFQEPQSQTFSEQSYVGQNAYETPAANLRSLTTTNNTIPSFELPANLDHKQLQINQSSPYGYSDFPKVEQRNSFNEPIHLQNVSSSFTHEQLQEESRSMFPCNSQTAANNLVSQNMVFQKRTSRLPEPILAVHPSINPQNKNTFDSGMLSGHGDEFTRFQEQSYRRRSSSDIVSLASLPISSNKVESPARKASLSRSLSYSNVGEGFGNVKNYPTSTGQLSPRRSSALRRVPSFEEFRTMRALNKMAYGERNDSETGQKGENDSKENSKDDNNSKEIGKDNNNNNDTNYNDSTFTSNNSISETTTTSLTSNSVIRDLLVKYGLDKSSSLNLNQHPKTGPDVKGNNSPAPSNYNARSRTSDTNESKQRLFNILDDFLAVRTKQKSLHTSSSMHNLKSASSSREQRRPSLPSDLVENNRAKNPNECSEFENKSLGLEIARDSHTNVSNLTDNKTEKCTSPTVVISRPNIEDSYEHINHKNTNITNQLKVHDKSKEIDKKSSSDRPRRKHKKASITERNLSENKLPENRSSSPNELEGRNSLKESNVAKKQSHEGMVPVSSEVKPRKREGSRRVSEQARKHRESLELVRRSGKKAKKERRKSFTEALQNKTKESSLELDKDASQDYRINDAQSSVSKRGPMKGDHTVDIESTNVEKKDARYLRLKSRRTSSLLSLTDDLGEYEEEDSFLNRSESLSEFNEEDSSQDQEIIRGDSILSVDTDFLTGRRSSRSESRSSLLSRCSSFHSNFSADSGSVQLDFEDSDDDDELFYLPQPSETTQKSETEVQRNDSGLGDEIGVGTRAKKRWQDAGYMSSRQSIIISSWRESAAKKSDRFEEDRGQVKSEDGNEGHKEIGQQKHGRKLSRERRISREKQPNAVSLLSI